MVLWVCLHFSHLPIARNWAPLILSEVAASKQNTRGGIGQSARPRGQRTLSLNLLFCVPFCSPRPTRFAECETHRGHSGQPTASLGAPAEAEPPRVLSALCQVAAENDRPQTDCHGTCAAITSHKENGDGHVSPSPPPRDLQGLVLAEKSSCFHWRFLLRLHYYFEGEI